MIATARSILPRLIVFTPLSYRQPPPLLDFSRARRPSSRDNPPLGRKLSQFIFLSSFALVPGGRGRKKGGSEGGGQEIGGVQYNCTQGTNNSHSHPPPLESFSLSITTDTFDISPKAHSDHLVLPYLISLDTVRSKYPCVTPSLQPVGITFVSSNLVDTLFLFCCQPPPPAAVGTKRPDCPEEIEYPHLF